jgi:2-dehydro-3-deoxygluconokinase
MSIHKVFCFGEILLHYAPPLGTNYIDSHQMHFYLGGAELNVATALANWDMPVKFATLGLPNLRYTGPSQSAIAMVAALV